MTKPILASALFLIAGSSGAFAGDHNPAAIIPLLKDSKMTLLQGIDYAERLSGVATSAKFEVEDGKLMLSVYTVPEGLGVEPEGASLTEVSGAASETPFKLNVEVFSDKEHIARASVHMTLFQLSRLTLKQVINRALAVRNGAPIDVRNPVVRNHRAVADVVIADEDGDSSTVSVDLATGRTTIFED